MQSKFWDVERRLSIPLLFCVTLFVFAILCHAMLNDFEFPYTKMYSLSETICGFEDIEIAIESVGKLATNRPRGGHA